jgi:hypothetical protein
MILRIQKGENGRKAPMMKSAHIRKTKGLDVF